MATVAIGLFIEKGSSGDGVGLEEGLHRNMGVERS